MKITKPNISLLTILIAVITFFVIVMFQDYKNYPPLPFGAPGYDYIGNYEGSLFNHLVLVFSGFFLALIVAFSVYSKHASISRLYYVILLIFIINSIWASSSIIHMGGIAVLYAFWSFFLSIFSLIGLFLMKKHLKKSND